MSAFEFNIDSELNNIRKRPSGGSSKPVDAKPQTTEPVAEEEKATPQAVEQTERPEPTPREIKQPEPEGFGINQSHQESNNSESGSPRRLVEWVNWKAFKPLKGVFDFVGGDRPVVLRDPIRRSQVSGIPEPLIWALQDQLCEQYLGLVVHFPWGDYEIDKKNKVFTAKPSLLRYLLFDGWRDGDGLQVQYAKQWLIGHIPTAFDMNFKPDASRTTDELDIYALLLAAHRSTQIPVAAGASKPNNDTSDQLILMNTNVNRLMEMVNNQTNTLETFAERNDTLQIVTLLDRMGLLRGGLPKDTGEFIRLLEQNRSEIETMSGTVDEHIAAENERRRVLQREERMKAAYTTRR